MTQIIAVAARACARNGMSLAGQSCASVQNVFVKESVYAAFVEQVYNEMGLIRFGDPMDAAAEVGTVIDEAAARRVEATIDRAAGSGAKVLCGGGRNGALASGPGGADQTGVRAPGPDGDGRRPWRGQNVWRPRAR